MCVCKDCRERERERERETVEVKEVKFVEVMHFKLSFTFQPIAHCLTSMQPGKGCHFGRKLIRSRSLAYTLPCINSERELTDYGNKGYPFFRRFQTA